MAEKKEHIILSDFGSDPDDDQSLISYLFFSNHFDTKAIVLTKPSGQVRHVQAVIDAYEKDYSKFRAYDPNYPTPNSLRKAIIDGRTKQGVKKLANLVKKSKATKKNPLYVTVWGNIHSLSEALDRIKKKHYKKITCISIDGWNKAQGPRPYNWLEQNAKTMKWLRIDQIARVVWTKGFSNTKTTNRQYVQFLDRHAGALGNLYKKVSAKVLSPGYPPSKTLSSMKEGDSPSWHYALWGNKNPKKKSIAGKFQKHRFGTRHFIEVQANRFKWEGWKAGKTYNREAIMDRYKERVLAIYK